MRQEKSPLQSMVLYPCHAAQIITRAAGTHNPDDGGCPVMSFRPFLCLEKGKYQLAFSRLTMVDCPCWIGLDGYDIEIELYESSASPKYVPCVLLLELQAFVGQAAKFHALRICRVQGNWIILEAMQCRRTEDLWIPGGCITGRERHLVWILHSPSLPVTCTY